MLWQNRSLSRQAKVKMYEGIVVPSMIYGSETWNMSASDRTRLEVVEMKSLRDICGLTRLDRVRNVDIRTRCELGVSIETKGGKNILRWFGHVERMSDERLLKKVYKSTIDGDRGRGRPKKRWRDCVKEYVEKRGVNWAGVEERANDRNGEGYGWESVWLSDL